jgi:dihydrolipoamide dehydrogenase
MSEYARGVSRFDLCVLGGGPAGVAAAIRGADLGKRVALVDGNLLGGAGIFDGALSSKTFWHLAMDFARACRSDRGYDGSGLTVSWPKVQAEVQAACLEAQALLARQLTALATPAHGRGTVERISGRGTFVARDEIQVGERTIAADRFVLAVGAKPRVPPNIAVDGVRIVTSDQIERVPELPRRLAIIGAGVVGCEYATIFALLGQTSVELFDRQARILPFEDADVAHVVAQRFSDIGVHVHRQAKIDKVVTVGDEAEVTWTDEAGATQTRRYDRVLVATGRVPATTGLGLELAGVNLDPRTSGVIVDDTRTSAPHVWAAGDITPDLMLANLAEIEARHAVEDMYGMDPPAIVREAQSAIYFFSPEVAAVGLNEQMAKDKGIGYRAAIVSNALNRRNIAMRAPTGFVKLLVRRDERLLGLRVVGPQAGTCIQGVALLIGQGASLEAVERCVHPHPAVTEGVLEAARLLNNRSLFKPDAMTGLCTIVEG